MTESTIPHTAGAEATVNAPATETLFDQDGVPVTVPAAAVEKFLRLGYTRQHADIPALLSEVAALTFALPAPWEAYTVACEARGVVDNAAQDTARVVLDALVEACNRLHLALHRRYPVHQED
jgi:hypothetical protein